MAWPVCIHLHRSVASLNPSFLKGQRGLNIEKPLALLAWSTGHIFGKTTLDEKSLASLQSHILGEKIPPKAYFDMVAKKISRPSG